jgi:hypothetical protein
MAAVCSCVGSSATVREHTWCCRACPCDLDCRGTNATACLIPTKQVSVAGDWNAWYRTLFSCMHCPPPTHE